MYDIFHVIIHSLDVQLIGHSGLVVRTLDSYLVEECEFELFCCHFKGWTILYVDYDYVECNG